jgi:hypothetical protein
MLYVISLLQNLVIRNPLISRVEPKAANSAVVALEQSLLAKKFEEPKLECQWVMEDGRLVRQWLVK